MKRREPETKLRIQKRAAETISIDIPNDTLEALGRIASGRDMSAEALVKLYIGQGLRQDLAKHLADRVLENTATVLAKHIRSKQELSAIIKEIRGASAT